MKCLILTLAFTALSLTSAVTKDAGPKTAAVSRQVDAEAAQERRAFWHYMEKCK
jgi:hypothetical protein